MVNLFKLKTDELKALVQYKDILEDNLRFPKNFWTDEKYQTNGIKIKSRILTKYCLENLAHIEPDGLGKYDLKEIKKVLVDHKLFGMIQTVYNHDILALLKNAYSEEFKNRVLREWMWSKHGLWHDDKLIIEAVQDMVRKEGIRRIDDIPKYDWKKRLIKFDIYNVLTYFNWSIYNLFNFVYPNKFHPTDFKYKVKWADNESLQNAFYHMHKVFRQKRLSMDDIILLGTADFRRLGLAGMVMGTFDSSVLKAKEYYLYKTTDNEENQNELLKEIKQLKEKKQDLKTLNKLKKVAVGKYIYNLHENYTLYNYIKRHAKSYNLSIDEFISRFGFIYKSAHKDSGQLNVEEIYSLRKDKGLTYVQIAKELGSNPTTISELCKKHFGGDPLIPRPLENYITVQELMDKYHVDHKTVMKLVKDNNFENHTTIRFRYLNKKEILPALRKYIKNNPKHKFMVSRYANLEKTV